MILYIFSQIFLHIDQNEMNKNPIRVEMPNPVGQAAEGLPQKGQTEDVEYTRLIISHHFKKEA
jgi:hypothetical protein